jgi:two-component system, sensor histidine kinase PdtaS
MEQKNKSSQEQIDNNYKVFLPLAADLLCIIDKDGNFINLNDNWELILGYNPKELEGMPFLNFIHPDDMPNTLRIISEQIESWEYACFANRFRRKNGSYRWFEWRSQPLNDVNYIAARDITKNKEIESALQESESKYRILLDESSDPIFIISSDGTYTYVNSAFVNGVDKQYEDVIHKKIWEVFPPQDAEQRFSAIRQVIRSGESKVIEVKVSTEKGTDFYVTTIQPITVHDGLVNSVMCSSKNITQRKLMEEALKLSEERFSKMFYNNPEALTINNLETRMFVDVNPAWTKLFGYSPHEVIGRNAALGDLNIWINPEESYKMITALKKDKVVTELELEFRKKDGTIFIGSFSAQIFEINNEMYYLINCRDITQQKLNEAELKNTAHQKELMLKELQHRIKNNLNVLSSLIGIAQDSLDDDRTKAVFSEAQARITTMSSIYQHLYNSPDFSKIELNVYFKGLTDTLFNLYNIGHTDIDLETDFIFLRLDSKRAEALALILNELISNALKYAFKNVISGKLKIYLTNKNNVVTLTVHDNGPGLPNNFDMQKITSLGLKLVKLLTTQIHGKLKVENDNGLRVQVSFQL